MIIIVKIISYIPCRPNLVVWHYEEQNMANTGAVTIFFRSKETDTEVHNGGELVIGEIYQLSFQGALTMKWRADPGSVIRTSVRLNGRPISHFFNSSNGTAMIEEEGTYTVRVTTPDNVVTTLTYTTTLPSTQA